jgi:hypothetical protein
MKTKWYVDADVDWYSIAHFEHCLRDVCHVFGIPILRKTGHVESNDFYHKSEFFFPDNVNEEDFDAIFNDSLASDEPAYYEE